MQNKQMDFEYIVVINGWLRNAESSKLSQFL